MYKKYIITLFLQYQIQNIFGGNFLLHLGIFLFQKFYNLKEKQVRDTFHYQNFRHLDFNRNGSYERLSTNKNCQFVENGKSPNAYLLYASSNEDWGPIYDVTMTYIVARNLRCHNKVDRLWRQGGSKCFVGRWGPGRRFLCPIGNNSSSQFVFLN